MAFRGRLSRLTRVFGASRSPRFHALRQARENGVSRRGSHNGKTLRSFGVNPGGYVGFFNPQTGQHETFSMKGDKEAAEPMKIKFQAKTARRAIRYQRFVGKGGAAKRTAAYAVRRSSP